MGANVFGSAITSDILPKVSQDTDDISMEQNILAKVAMKMKNSEGKDIKAFEYAASLKQFYKTDGLVCLIYNATGNSVTIDTECSRSGTAGSPYPLIIANGQWGAFIRLRPTQHSHADCAVVYAATNVDDGSRCQFLFLLGYGESHVRCHTEIQRALYFPKHTVRWQDQYGNKLNACWSTVSTADSMGFSSFASIGGTSTSAIFEGIMTLQGAWSS